MDTKQEERFRQAVDRKSEEADAASKQQPAAQNPHEPEIRGDQPELTDPGQEQDTLSVRDKNSGHGQKTADKWNQ